MARERPMSNEKHEYEDAVDEDEHDDNEDLDESRSRRTTRYRTDTPPNNEDEDGNSRLTDNGTESTVGSLCQQLGTDDGDGGKRLSSSATYPTMSFSCSSSSSSLSTMGGLQSGGDRLTTTTVGNNDGRWNRMIRNRWSRSQRSRRSSKQQSPPPPPSQDLFLAQLRVLSTLTGASLTVFLITFLNIYAFSALLSTLLFFSLLLHTIRSYLLHLLQSDDFTIYEQLPSSIQELLTTTILHDYMTDDSTTTTYVEGRFLLLYFLPGLTTQQRLAMAQNLPERHRDTVFSPGGMARYFLPDTVYRRLAPQCHNSDSGVRTDDATTGINDSTAMVPMRTSSATTTTITNVSTVRQRINPTAIPSQRQALQGVATTDNLQITTNNEHDHLTTPHRTGANREHGTHQNETTPTTPTPPVTMRHAFASLIYVTRSLLFGEATPPPTTAEQQQPPIPPTQGDVDELFYIVNEEDYPYGNDRDELMQDLSWDGDEYSMVDQSVFRIMGQPTPAPIALLKLMIGIVIITRTTTTTTPLLWLGLYQQQLHRTNHTLRLPFHHKFYPCY